MGFSISQTPYTWWMAEVEVHIETEASTHWSYGVRVFAEGRTREHRVTLSFQDYDLWCHGRVAPSRVVEACFGFLLERESADEILERFDCAVIRRYFPEVDTELPALV